MMACEKCKKYSRKIELCISQLKENNEKLNKFSKLLEEAEKSIKEKDDVMIVLNEKI